MKRVYCFYFWVGINSTFWVSFAEIHTQKILFFHLYFGVDPYLKDKLPEEAPGSLTWLSAWSYPNG